MLSVLIKIGPVTIYSYGFFLTLAYIAGTFILWREGKRQGYQVEKLLDLSLIALVAALLGGRVYFSLSHLNLLQENFLSALAFWEGGLSFYGAFFGVFVAGFLVTKRWKWPFFQVADFAALSGLAAFSIVKVGTFFAGTDLGTPADVPWAMEFPNILSARHPVQLYEAAFAFSLLFIMKKVYENNLKSAEIKSGKVFLHSILLLSTARLFFEFFRADSTYIFGIKSVQIISLLVAIVSAIALYCFRYREAKKDLESFLKLVLSVNSRVLNRLNLRLK